MPCLSKNQPWVRFGSCAGITAAAVLLTASAGAQPTGELVEDIAPFLEEGGRVDWHPRSGTILVDHQEEDGYFDIYQIDEDGSGRECLTCDHPDLPNKNIGNPAFHPSGRFMVFQVQNDYPGLGEITDWFANPGAGVNNDLYIMNLETREVTRITEVPPAEGGVLHPHFSPSGTKLLWSERYDSSGDMGLWQVRIGEVRLVGDRLEVGPVTNYTPGEQKVWYETHGFSPDERSVLFSGCLLPRQEPYVQDIYRFDYRENKLHRLTPTLNHWDEHAHVSPSGRHIVWMSSMEVEKPSADTHTDYWVMNADGSHQRRLTYFNQEGHPHFIEGGATAADFAWSDDGKRILAYVILSLRPHRAINLMIEFQEPF